jgi:hypothetical protein
LSRQAQALDVARDRVIQVVADEQVEPPVAIDVDERRRHAPPVIGRAALAGHVGEGAVALVLEQLVRAERRDVQIDAPVVVVVASGGAHPVGAHVDAARVRHIRELERVRGSGLGGRAAFGHGAPQVVPEQPRPQRSLGFHRRAIDGDITKHPALDHEHVEVAVIVVVEERDARRHHFGIEERAGPPVEMDEGQAGPIGRVPKPLDGGRRRGVRRCGSAGEEQEVESEEWKVDAA